MFACKPYSGNSSVFRLAILASAIVVGSAAYVVHSAEPETGAGQAPAAQRQGGAPDVGAMLVGGLQSTPGCLGVDTAKFASGKNTIFAWFENREAVLRWYHSEAHKAAMGMFFPGHKTERKPLEGIPEDYDGPILTIAAITFAKPDEMQKTGRPFSQISIELYAPLKGGLSINGTLAPASMKVPGGVDVSDEYTGAPGKQQAQ